MNAIGKITTAERSFFDDWTMARPYLLSAMHMLEGMYAEEDIIAAVLAGQMRLWIGDRCAAVTQFVQYPRGKFLNTVIAGAAPGCMDNLLALGADHVEFGLEHGCTKVQVAGRPGWQKVFPGFEFRAVTLLKDL